MDLSSTNAMTGVVEAETPASGIDSFGLDAKIFAAQLINFTIVLLVLWKFVYKPIVARLEKREQMVAKSVADSASVDERLRKIEEERVNVLGAARSEAKKVIEEAQVEADKRRETQLDRAKEEVARVVTEGKEQLNAERVASVRELRAEIADLAVGATKKILEGTVDEKKAKSLAEEAVRKMTKKS